MITNTQLDQYRRMTEAELEAIKMGAVDVDSLERSEIANALIKIIQHEREIANLNGYINKMFRQNAGYYTPASPERNERPEPPPAPVPSDTTASDTTIIEALINEPPAFTEMQSRLLKKMQDGRYIYCKPESFMWCDDGSKKGDMYSDGLVVRPLIDEGYLYEQWNEVNGEWEATITGQQNKVRRDGNHGKL